jgi:hypothetical protein
MSAVAGRSIPRQTVLDALSGADARALAEFSRRLLGQTYRAGDEPPAAARTRRSRCTCTPTPPGTRSASSSRPTTEDGS